MIKVKRYYKPFLQIFDSLSKNVLTTMDFRTNFSKVNGYSVSVPTIYQTLSRAVRDGILIRTEEGYIRNDVTV